MAKFSFPLVIGNLAAWILSLSDRYILKLFRGSLEVGIYSVSYSISQYTIMTLTSLFLLSFNPLSIITWEKKGEKATKKFIVQGTRYFVLLCIPAVIGISVLQNPILSVLSTSDYYEGAKIIPLVALGVFFLGLVQIFDTGLCLQKKTYINMLCVTLSSILNLGLNFLLVPKYGYIAAAFTTLISYAFLLCLMIIVSRRFFLWEFPFKSLTKAMCASSVMGIVVYHIGNNLTSSTLLNLILSVVVGVVAYLLMLFLMREFKPSEIQALLDLKAKIRR
jgi:O-antigen/teichoic acid export membrane protein